MKPEEPRFGQHIMQMEIQKLIDEVERLRGLLARLEWPETLPGAGPWHVCPICSNTRDEGHETDCWLGEEVAGEWPLPPEPEALTPPQGWQYGV